MFFIGLIEGVARSVYDDYNERNSSDDRDSSRRQIIEVRSQLFSHLSPSLGKFNERWNDLWRNKNPTVLISGAGFLTEITCLGLLNAVWKHNYISWILTLTRTSPSHTFSHPEFLLLLSKEINPWPMETFRILSTWSEIYGKLFTKEKGAGEWTKFHNLSLFCAIFFDISFVGTLRRTIYSSKFFWKLSTYDSSLYFHAVFRSPVLQWKDREKNEEDVVIIFRIANKGLSMQWSEKGFELHYSSRASQK